MQKIQDDNLQGSTKCASETADLLLDDELRTVVHALKQLPDLEAPASLLPSVMSALRERRLPWYRRLYNWARAPRSITLSPLRIAFATVLLLVGTSLLFTRFPAERQSHLAQLQGERVPVVFMLTLPNAQSVAVVGSFNQWRPQGFEMQGAEQHQWTITLELPQGRYEYAFLVDGKEMIPDPHASFYQNDGFGNQNAVLILGESNGQAI
ncbi:isoamylase early set domain-containing protein [Desulfoferrobacter suflitae]|uniref:isoamylase early set domain-containing protein n=1 Tax=Desulfoferrobacter suflitae TaxID=2865782 RepID=UPI0021642943|nr:isoamylase early set domain-containing protein [Desulfoferrobacter suflitae]MCK8602110.1 isoamylase early set domain-containing protein [Desulfoferrobacter suflitae]